MKIVRLLLHFLFSSIITIVSACILQTQMVIFGLTELGVEVPINDRVHMTWLDLLGLFPSYGIIIIIGLAIAFACTKAIFHFTAAVSYYWYVLAGGVAMFVIILAMQPVLGVTLLAGARSSFGISLQILAGLLGGFCFSTLRRLGS